MDKQVFSGPGDQVKALYVHVPFCRAKCRYCDFYSLPVDDSTLDAYLRAVANELALMRPSLAEPLESIYVGGGTPTVLGPEGLNRLLPRLSDLGDENTQFSIEANPATVDRAVASCLAAAGVNRVTLGAQSFDEAELRCLGRIHSARRIRRAVDAIRAAGIDNVGLDLIYGIPGQSPASWGRSLDSAAGLWPAHLSGYALSFEAGTPLAGDLRAGLIAEVDDETQRAMYYGMVDRLAAAGLEQYEISNFARPGRRSRQNLTYWHNQPYLGLGPAACSYLAGRRRSNAADLEAYLRSLLDDPPAMPPATSEHLTGRAAMAETLMLALRLVDGVCIEDFHKRFGRTATEAFGRTIRRYLDQGAMEKTPTHLRLAREARFVADTILADLLAEANLSATPSV